MAPGKAQGQTVMRMDRENLNAVTADVSSGRFMRIFFLTFWIPYIIFISALPAWPENSGIDLLKQKMVEIHTMDNTIEKKHGQIVDIHGHLDRLLKKLTAEIQAQKDNRPFVGLQDPAAHPRVGFNVQLIRRLNAILSVLQKRIEYFREGRQRLAFLSRQAQDDVMIMQTVSRMTVDRLISKIDRTLAEYQVSSRAPVIDGSRLQMESHEKTFEGLMLN